MAVNLVVQGGVVRSLALKYDQQSRPELRFTLEQRDYATDGQPWTLYLPCCASGKTAERLASELEDGQQVVISSGKLCYRKRETKMGLQSRMEISVWLVDKLSDDSGAGGSVSLEGAAEIVAPAPNVAVPATKGRRPRPNQYIGKKSALQN